MRATIILYALVGFAIAAPLSWTEEAEGRPLVHVDPSLIRDAVMTTDKIAVSNQLRPDPEVVIDQPGHLASDVAENLKSVSGLAKGPNVVEAGSSGAFESLDPLAEPQIQPTTELESEQGTLAERGFGHTLKKAAGKVGHWLKQAVNGIYHGVGGQES